MTPRQIKVVSHSRRFWVLLAAWLCTAAPLCRVAFSQEVRGGEIGGGERGTVFGSQVVLECCWSEQERLGRFEERLSTREASPKAASAPPQFADHTSLPPVKDEWRESIRRVELPVGQKAIALTFDLCETAGERSGYDAALIQALRRHKAKATLFAGGKWMKTHAERAKQLMADPLFEIGNHTWTHVDCRLADGHRIREQVSWTQAQYERLRLELAESPCVRRAGDAEMSKIPLVPRTFRFPYGACRPEALRIVAEAGLPAIQWDVVLGDPVQGQPVSNIVQTVLKRARPGSIVVGHANGRGFGTAEALDIVIPQLMAQGFRFVTVSELLRFGKAIRTSECYEESLGETMPYDQRHRKRKP